MGFRGTAESENQDMPHFNWEGKRKQHETHEARWASRPKKEHVVELSTVIKFAAVSGILGFTMVLTSEWKRERTETKRKGRA